MEVTKRMSELKVHYIYTVHGYSEIKPYNFGEYCILKVSEEDSDDIFEIWSTSLLVSYIKEVKPTGKFIFMVKKRNKIKYPFIENYTNTNFTNNFTMLD